MTQAISTNNSTTCPIQKLKDNNFIQSSNNTIGDHASLTPIKTLSARIVARKALSSNNNMPLNDLKIKGLSKKMKEACQDGNLGIRLTSKKNEIRLQGTNNTTVTIRFSEVMDNGNLKIFLKLGYLKKDKTAAFDLLDKLLEKIDDSNSMNNDDGERVLQFQGTKIILPEQRTISTTHSQSPALSLDYTVPLTQEIHQIGEIKFGENYNQGDQSQFMEAVEATAILAINDETYVTPPKDRKQRIQFLNELKTQLNQTGNTKLIDELGAKLEDLKSFSYNKPAFERVIDLYTNALKIANHEENIEKLNEMKSQYDGADREQFLNLSKEAKLIYKAKIKAINPKKNAYKNYIVQALNCSKNAWQRVNNTFQFSSKDNIKVPITSITTPAREMNIFDHLQNDNVRGISSNDRQSEHLQNSWSTELQIETQTVFKGLRHGCINNKKSRVQELLQLAIYQQLGADNFNALDNNASVDLNLSSTQLLTHTNVAGDGKIGLNQIEQLKKFLPTNGDPIDFELQLPGGHTKKIKLKLNLLTFNFGVNLQTRIGLGRSEEEDKINLDDLKKLFGEKFFSKDFMEEVETAGDLENDLSDNFDEGCLLKQKLNQIENEIENADSIKKQNLEKQKEILLTIADQIRELWVTGKYREAKENPYAMPTRIAYLTYKLGFISSFNCKSGKDRTGVLDAEIKNLAAYIAINHEVPSIENKTSRIEETNLSTIHAHCGSYEVLASCTGVLGSKIPFMSPIFYNRFSPAYKEEFMGVTNNFSIV